MKSSGRRWVSGSAKWESIAGYSRATRVGAHIHVAGTTAIDENGELVGRDDPYRQAVQCIANIRSALQQLDADLSHVVRTRIYVTNIGEWEQIGRAHQEAFGTVRPAATMVEVRRLISPGIRVEIEADAIVPEDN